MSANAAPTLGTIQHALDQVGCGAYWLAMADQHEWIDRVAVERTGQRAVMYAVQVVEVTSDQLMDALAYGRHLALTGGCPLGATASPGTWIDGVTTPGVTL
ncbi:hypothetical protein HH308_06195 [Gordonia sp. TBRC 11910]|uniref:Uncharacterized protein n=1 Tax=Gordonia asplenii TaxID=2725283 RepID=A0A848KRC3_9ACTN|nr:hypothetical protein [Gordonia asplenii]NMO00802.1 hypothetical protein [Gordonia asplenii]